VGELGLDYLYSLDSVQLFFISFIYSSVLVCFLAWRVRIYLDKMEQRFTVYKFNLIKSKVLE
jgi:hypothetical protein